MNNKHVKSYRSFYENYNQRRRPSDPRILEARPAFIKRLKYITTLSDSEFLKRGKLSYLKFNTRQIWVNGSEFCVRNKLKLSRGFKLPWILTLDENENEIKRKISNMPWKDYIRSYLKREIMIQTHEEYAKFIRQILNRLLLCILNKEEIVTHFDIDVVDIGRYADTLHFGHNGKFADVNHLGKSEGGTQTFVYTFISYFVKMNKYLFPEEEFKGGSIEELRESLKRPTIKKIINGSNYPESDLGLPHLEMIWASCEDDKKKERYVTGFVPSHHKNLRPDELSEQK